VGSAHHLATLSLAFTRPAVPIANRFPTARHTPQPHPASHCLRENPVLFPAALAKNPASPAHRPAAVAAADAETPANAAVLQHLRCADNSAPADETAFPASVCPESESGCRPVLPAVTAGWPPFHACHC